jgi:hypothetical protein
MSEIATLNKSILGLSGNIEDFIKSLGNMETRATTVNKKVKELTKAQDALGLSYRDNIKGEKELFNKKTKLRVDRFGAALGEAGKKMTSFNKRTSIISESIKELNKTNERFNLGFKSFSTYTKMGGNAFEYLAEFISSGREEITIFGVEAAKARKFLYGFLPAGVFRMLNKFSSTLQLVGGQYRKLVTDSGAAKEEVEKLKMAIENFDGDPDELKGLKKRLEELEVPDGIFSTVFKGFKKMKKFVSKPLQLNFDQEGIYEMDSTFRKTTQLMKKNFGMTLTDDVDGKRGTKSERKYLKERKRSLLQQQKGSTGADFGVLTKEIKAVEQKIADIDDKAIQGIRKRYRDLGKEMKASKKLFKFGMDAEEVVKNQEALVSMKDNLSDVEKGIRFARQQAEAFESVAFLGDEEDAKKAIEFQQQLEDLLKEQLELQRNIAETTVQEKGIKKVMKEIDEQDKLLKKKEGYLELMDKDIKKLEYTLELLEAEQDASFDPQKQIQIAGVQAEIAQKEGQKLETEGAITKDKESLEALNEQKDLLKEMRENSIDKLLEKHPFFKGINKLRKGLKQVIPALRMFLKAFMMGFMYVSLAILGILALVKIFGPIIKDTIGTIIKVLAPIIEFTMGAIGLIFDGVKQVFGAFFGDGTFEDAIDGLLKIGAGILGVVVSLAIAALVALGTLVVAGIGHAIVKVKGFFKEMFSSWKGFLKSVAVIIAIAGTIIALIMGAPVWLALVIGIALFKGVKLIIKGIKWLADKINPKKKVKKFLGGIRDKVTGRATGGTVRVGETTLVGENGPELVKLPAGSRVFTNARTRKMAKGTANTNNNTINITINAKDTSDAEMRRIAEKVGRLVNSSINRNTGMSGIR